ncbi:MAG: hypothetical protein FIA96_05865 [Betaproteobacteria bacterium]|nr:hypothetical protein [Betaproteobacteria bacterium]
MLQEHRAHRHRQFGGSGGSGGRHRRRIAGRTCAGRHCLAALPRRCGVFIPALVGQKTPSIEPALDLLGVSCVAVDHAAG